MATANSRTRSPELLDAAWSMVMLTLAADAVDRWRFPLVLRFGEQLAAEMPAELARIREEIAKLRERDTTELADLLRVG